MIEIEMEGSIKIQHTLRIRKKNGIIGKQIPPMIYLNNSMKNKSKEQAKNIQD